MMIDIKFKKNNKKEKLRRKLGVIFHELVITDLLKQSE